VSGAVLSLALFGLVGLAVRRVAGDVQPFLAGMGVVALVLFAAGVTGVPLVPALLALLAASAAVALLVRRRDEASLNFPRLPTIIGLAGAAWLSALAVTLPLEDYDGRAFWLLKAKAIANELDVDGPFFHDETSTSPRNEYPLLVPLNGAAIMLAAGDLDDRHVRLMYVLLAIGFALAIRDGLARLTSPAVGAWAAALFMWLPQIGPEPDGGALTGSADIALGAFVACAFFELALARSPWRFGFWLPMIALTKSEGLPLALLLLALGCLTFRWKALRAAVPLSIGLLLLWQWRRGIDPSDESDYGTLIWTFPDQLSLFGRVVGDFVSQVWAFHDWGALWLAALLATFWLVHCRKWRVVGLAAGVIVPTVLLYAAVIAVTDWDLYLMADSVGPRLMTHLVGPCMALLGCGLTARREASPD
jgi:hypothetical protein